MKKRFVEYDFARAIAMIFVIIFHMQNNLVGIIDDKLLYMANTIIITCNGIFFMISGKFLLEREIENIPKFYLDRFVKIIVPVIIASVIYYFSRVDFNVSGETIKGCIKALVQNEGQTYFWFIYTLSCLYLLTPFLKKMLDACSDKWLMILIIQSVIVMIVFNIFEILGLKHPFTSYSFYNWLLFFIMGYSIDRLVKTNRQENIILIIAIVMYGLSISEFLLKVNNPSRWDYSVSYLSMCCGMYILITRKARKLAQKFSGVITILSSTSFVMYIVHGFTMEITKKLIDINNVNVWKWPLLNITVVIITFLVSLPIWYFIYRPLVKLFNGYIAKKVTVK